MTGRKTRIMCCVLLSGLLGLAGCSSPSSGSAGNEISAASEADDTLGLKPEGSMELLYAEHFSVEYYEGGYRKLATMDGTEILVVPEGKEAPEGLKEDVIILDQPVENLYLVASSVMDMFCRLDGLDAIRFSGQKEESWYIEKAKAAMAAGDILYAGKYNQPDYELIVSENCSLAIENRMITHTPEVKEMLEDFGIPVMIEYSSYEPHPLGRVEWIKFFGAMLGKEAEAEAVFQEQADILSRIIKAENTDRTAAFFFITANGQVQVRQSADYIPKMLRLAGGRYTFENLGDSESGRSTVNMQVEAFYDGAKDSDFLIYNSSIDGGVASLSELLDKCPVLADFKAVKDGNVWCTTGDVYQQSMSVGYLLEDFYSMFHEKPEEEMHYLFRLK